MKGMGGSKINSPNGWKAPSKGMVKGGKSNAPKVSLKSAAPKMCK